MQNVTNDNNAPSLKYKASVIGNTENNGIKKRSTNSCTTKKFK